MKSNGIRLAYIIAITYAFLGSFLFLRGLDNAGVLGADAVVQVSGNQTVPSAEVVNTVRHIADDHRAIIGRTIDDVREPGTRRHLYLGGGDPHGRAAHWLTDGYPPSAQTPKRTCMPYRNWPQPTRAAITSYSALKMPHRHWWIDSAASASR